MENGQLRLHNLPVPILETGGTTSVVKTLRDRVLLEEQWSNGKAKWKVW